MILLLFLVDIDSRVAILFLHLSHEQTLHELSESLRFLDSAGLCSFRVRQTLKVWTLTSVWIQNW